MIAEADDCRARMGQAARVLGRDLSDNLSVAFKFLPVPVADRALYQ